MRIIPERVIEGQRTTLKNCREISLSCSQVTKAFAVLLVCIISYFHMLSAQSEYPFFIRSPLMNWHIHHDEKLLVPDARYFFLHSNSDIDISDYKPFPVSAAFGLAGPTLMASGFHLFGLNGTGLRIFFIFIAGVSSTFTLLLILRLAPGVIGLIGGPVYLFTYSNFVLNHYAILEHALTFFLLSILWLYISHRNIFLRHIHWIGFAAAISVLFKINFPPYLYVLLFLIALVEKQGVRTIGKLVVWSGLGIILFEGFHLLLLWKMGIVHWRYYNLLQVLKLHSGSDIGQLQNFRPPGLKIFLHYLGMFADWYGVSTKYVIQTLQLIDKVIFHPTLLITLGLLFIFFLGYMLSQKLYRMLPRYIWAIILFITVYLLFSSNFLFYLKRAVSLFPLTFIVLNYLLFTFFEKARKTFPQIRYAFVLGLLGGAIMLLGPQVLQILSSSGETDNLVELNSKALDDVLPKGSIVYTHCYGYRFFWQAMNVRLMSADDQIMNNQKVFEWARENQAKYFLFSLRGFPIDSKYNRSLRLIKKYHTTSLESDVPDEYYLFEITENHL